MLRAIRGISAVTLAFLLRVVLIGHGSRAWESIPSVNLVKEEIENHKKVYGFLPQPTDCIVCRVRDSTN